MFSRSHACSSPNSPRSICSSTSGSPRSPSPRSGRRARCRGGRSGSSRSCRSTSARPGARRARRSAPRGPELLEARVPGVGKVGDGEPAREELLLELEAEDDVEAVARLVGVDADERAANAVDRAMELLERDVAEPVRERLLHARVEPAPERQRAADDVLPEPALRLVERRRDARRRAACARASGLTPHS